MNNVPSTSCFGVLVLAIIGAGASTPFITKQCVELQVPVPVVATNHHYVGPRVDSTIDAIQWTVNSTTWSTNASIADTFLLNRTFGINAQLCFPAQTGTKTGILHIATQGLAFDKRSVVHSLLIDPKQQTLIGLYSVQTVGRADPPARQRGERRKLLLPRCCHRERVFYSHLRSARHRQVRETGCLRDCANPSGGRNHSGFDEARP